VFNAPPTDEGAAGAPPPVDESTLTEDFNRRRNTASHFD